MVLFYVEINLDIHSFMSLGLQVSDVEFGFGIVICSTEIFLSEIVVHWEVI